MMPRTNTLKLARTALWALALTAIGVASRAAEQPTESLEDAFERFCAAEIGKRRSQAAVSMVESGASFDESYDLFKEGCALPTKVKFGERYLNRKNQDGVRHPFLVLIPEDYDPMRRYPVRVFLHGGISRPPFTKGETWWRKPERNAGDWITVYPASWQSSMWWHASQIENLAGILDRLKRTYNIDENRVYLIGISDGASGIYYQAMRDPTPWTAFLPFIGSAGVVAHPSHRDGDFHLPNFSNRSFFIVNGEDDRLYPAKTIEPFIDILRASGAEVVFRPLPGFGHELRWWPEESDRIEEFIGDHIRDPLPDHLEWETEWTDKFARIHWLVVTGIGSIEDESHFVDPGKGFFKHTSPYGRIVAERSGNTIDVKTQGVSRFKILVSPAQFDLTRPITIKANGKQQFDARVKPSVETLVSWAAIDLDRTMLFAAEIEINLD